MLEQTPQQNLLHLFCERFRKLNGEVILASDTGDVVRKVSELIKSHGVKSVFVSPLFKELEDHVITSLSKEVRVFRMEDVVDNPVGKLDAVEAGISAAAAAIAETGTLVEIAYDDVDRLASSMPKLHIMLVKASTVVKSVNAVAGLIRESFKARRAAVTLISGPSRSGDIEQRLVVGIHGPHVVVAVVLTWL
ncbi:MAG: LUD domain-containing protein [Candidatus Caldarchaeum sp.]